MTTNDFCSLNCLHDDVLMSIFMFLKPHHIIRLYNEFPQIVVEIFQRNIYFKMPCKKYINQCIVEWFERKNLPLDLLIEIKTDLLYTRYFKNGKLHRDNDLPAVVSHKYGQVQSWYKNGERHRDDKHKPAYIVSYENEKVIYLKWFQNDVNFSDYSLKQPSSGTYTEIIENKLNKYSRDKIIITFDFKDTYIDAYRCIEHL